MYVYAYQFQTIYIYIYIRICLMIISGSKVLISKLVNNNCFNTIYYNIQTHTHTLITHHYLYFGRKLEITRIY